MTGDHRIFTDMSSRALLISNDANTLNILGPVLGEMEISLEPCHDSAQAVDKLAVERYAVVLVDTPEDEAEQLLRRVRSSYLNRNSLAICLVEGQASVRSVFALGANLVLYRPVSADRVRASLRAAYDLIKREKRKHVRLPVHADASISCPTVEEAPVTLVDLSEEGLAFQSEQRLPSKGKVYFRFTLPGQTKFVQLSGEIVWQDSAGRAGIHFVSVPQTAQRLLKEWLDSRVANGDQQTMLQVPLPSPSPAAASERRVQFRHNCNLGTEIYLTGSTVPHRCSLTDISTGGCYVEIPSPFASGTLVEIVVRTADFKFRSSGIVQVVSPGFGMGVAFGAQGAEQKRQVQQLIKMVHSKSPAGSTISR